MLGLLIKNSASNMVVPLLKIIIVFIMAPVILKALGNYDYGIWEVVFSVVGYMGILDLGLQPAIVRYVARYNALGNRDEMHRIYSSSLLFMAVMSLVMFGAFAGGALWAPGLLAGDGGDHSKYAFFLVIIGVQLMFTFSGSVFECFFEGFQLYNLRNAVTVFNLIVGNTILYILLKNGGGLLTLALLNGIGLSLKYTVYGLLLATRRFGGFRFRAADVSRRTLKELLSFGYKSLIHSVAGRISMATDAIVIGSFLGPVAVTFFVIPANFINHVRNMTWAMTRAFMPLFSDLDARGDRDSSEKVLMTGSRFVLGLILPILTGLSFLGLPFLSRWMGPEYAEQGKWVLYIFIAAYLVQWLNPFSLRLLTGIGRQGLLAKINSVSAALNIVLSVILVQYLGKEGVALGTLIPFVLLEPLLLYYTCRLIGRRVTDYAGEVLLPLLVPNALFALLLWFLTGTIEPGGYPAIFGIGLFSFGVYLLLFYAVSVRRTEKEFLLAKLRARFA